MNARIFDLLYFGTAHPDDGQKWPKNVGATNWENMYHLCILLVFINNYVKSFLYSGTKTGNIAYVVSYFERT